MPESLRVARAQLGQAQADASWYKSALGLMAFVTGVSAVSALYSAYKWSQASRALAARRNTDEQGIAVFSAVKMAENMVLQKELASLADRTATLQDCLRAREGDLREAASDKRALESRVQETQALLWKAERERDVYKAISSAC